ncbi:MAG: hypothetical protein ACK4UJ_10695 [Leptonema sp. (in: bacteria)]
MSLEKLLIVIFVILSIVYLLYEFFKVFIKIEEKACTKCIESKHLIKKRGSNATNQNKIY